MLLGDMIHPELVSAISICGHGDKLLIADGNYPLASKSGESKKIYLGLTPGMPNVTQVLKAILSCINVEKVEIMLPETGPEPEIVAELRDILSGTLIEGMTRQEFYRAASAPEVFLAISTGELRTYSNVLVTVGVR